MARFSFIFIDVWKKYFSRFFVLHITQKTIADDDGTFRISTFSFFSSSLFETMTWWCVNSSFVNFSSFWMFFFVFFQKKSVGSSIFLFYVSLLFIYWKRHQPFTNPWILIKLKLIHELIDYYNFKKKIVLLCSNSFCLSWDDGAVYITMWWMLTVLSVEFIVASGNTKKTCQPVTLIISFHLLKMCCNVAPVQLKRPPTQLETANSLHVLRQWNWSSLLLCC